MIKTLFFAKIRDELGVSELALQANEGFADIPAMINALVEKLGDQAGEILTQPNVIVAVNHSVAEQDQQILDGDEVAFYPPVTGG